jgi:lipoprotein NlpI
VEEALKLAAEATKADAKNPAGPFVTGQILLANRKPAEAVAPFTEAIKLDPNFAAAYDRRGDAYLKSGQFKESVADFDKFLQFQPKFAPEHWRRGIALYYAGRFADGVKQFDIHRTVNPEDVENSAWHYLCNVRANGKATAVKDLIPVSQDARVPMAQVLELFAGKLKPQDVIDAAEKSGLKDRRLTSARFYAHLYVALYYAGEGDEKQTKEHLTEAVEKYKVPDYMWDVAAAHLALMNKTQK